MAEKSGIEMLEELLEEVKLLHRKVDLLDRNLKQVANSAKMADLLERAAGTSLDTFSRANGVKAKIEKVDAQAEIARVKEKASKGMRFKFEPADASKIKQPTALAQKGRVAATAGPKNIMVQGKMVIEQGDNSLPLSQIKVTIFDAKDNVVKETKTNRAGRWMSQLPPGQYVAKFEGEYGGKKLMPVNKAFEVPTELPPGQKELEIQ